MSFSCVRISFQKTGTFFLLHNFICHTSTPPGAQLMLIVYLLIQWSNGVSTNGGWNWALSQVLGHQTAPRAKLLRTAGQGWAEKDGSKSACSSSESSGLISFRIDWFDLAILHAHNLHILLDKGGPRSWDSREVVNGDPWCATARMETIGGMRSR